MNALARLHNRVVSPEHSRFADTKLATGADLDKSTHTHPTPLDILYALERLTCLNICLNGGKPLSLVTWFIRFHQHFMNQKHANYMFDF